MAKNQTIISFFFSWVLFTVLCGPQPLRAADAYPAKPISFVVPIEAGSDGDIVSRPLAEKASAILGKPIVIVNKPGGGSSIGYREVYGSKPDGYRIGMATITIVTNKVQGLMPLDHHDFTLLGTFYRMYANIYGSTKTKHPFKTIQEVILYAKDHPGEIKLAASGIGASLWIGAMAFIVGTGIDINVIPQPGAAGFAMAQLAGGHMGLAVTHMAAGKPQMDGGNVTFLAVVGEERDPAYPNVPTLKDLGYNVSWESCGVLIGPPKMPAEVKEKLIQAFEKAANDPEYKKFLTDRFATPFYLAPDKVIPYLDGKRKLVRDIMTKAGIIKE
jgi:tripartite-type tricarboxylate transporter receptor subunit TctC